MFFELLPFNQDHLWLVYSQIISTKVQHSTLYLNKGIWSKIKLRSNFRKERSLDRSGDYPNSKQAILIMCLSCPCPITSFTSMFLVSISWCLQYASIVYAHQTKTRMGSIMLFIIFWHQKMGDSWNSKHRLDIQCDNKHVVLHIDICSC